MKKYFALILIISFLFVGCESNIGKRSYIFKNNSSKTITVSHSSNYFESFNIGPNSNKTIFVDADYLFTNQISAVISDNPSHKAKIEEGSVPNEIELVYKELNEVIQEFLNQYPRIVTYETSFPDFDVCVLTWDIFSEPYIGDWIGERQALLRHRYEGTMYFNFSTTGGWDGYGATMSDGVFFVNYI